ncbi:MAG: hypothetical protein Q9M36_12400 [Sulfurovum sp.]|nr:hypothetical protein [Sulfurovum sp.]
MISITQIAQKLKPILKELLIGVLILIVLSNVISYYRSASLSSLQRPHVSVRAS